ncbi:hypothetical protein CJP74_00540 [Psittacicella melopsittaci]|uniref:Alpha/beta hydrolase n=1 Tax=Psittacicella melopsittaci TaxID=2028576 RepID=A0A3A1Y8G0_9GAMM|nr:hypothetical protein [Psittacicella melopsittaci]RIY33945.1 hypothetical protein CJP74_00540 [Psittacicella melopsittaci]
MLNFRLNTYALTAKFAQLANLRKPVNIVYFHGFTMHDNNYLLAAAMAKTGLLKNLEGKELTQFEFYNDPEALAKVEAKLNTLPASETEQQNFGNFITVSLDYGKESFSLNEVIPEFVKLLGRRKTIFFAYSYGNLIAQLFMQRLNNLAGEEEFVFQRLVGVYGINGSLLPYDDNYSIPAAIALKTALTWTRNSFYMFAVNMGMPKEQLQLVRQRVENVADNTILAQQQTLKALIRDYDMFLSYLNNPALTEKWRSIQAATDDKIFPLENLLKLGRAYKIPIRTARGPHYLAPAELLEILCASTCYEEV